MTLHCWRVLSSNWPAVARLLWMQGTAVERRFHRAADSNQHLEGGWLWSQVCRNECSVHRPVRLSPAVIYSYVVKWIFSTTAFRPDDEINIVLTKLLNDSGGACTHAAGLYLNNMNNGVAVLTTGGQVEGKRELFLLLLEVAMETLQEATQKVEGWKCSARCSNRGIEPRCWSIILSVVLLWRPWFC